MNKYLNFSATQWDDSEVGSTRILREPLARWAHSGKSAH